MRSPRSRSGPVPARDLPRWWRGPVRARDLPRWWRGPVRDRGLPRWPGGPVRDRGLRRRQDEEAGDGRVVVDRGGPVRARGSAVVELVLLGVPLLVPLLYLAVVLTAVRQAGAGVTEAARQAGRAYVTGTAGTAPARAADAARRALADRGVPTDGMRIRYAAAGSACDRSAEPLRPGAVFAVCVTARVPDVLPGGRREITGRFLVRADDHRDYR